MIAEYPIPATLEDIAAVKRITPHLSEIYDQMLADGSIKLIDGEGRAGTKQDLTQ